MQKRILIILMFTVVMAGIVIVLFSALRAETEDLVESQVESVLTPSEVIDKEVFSLSSKALDFKDMPESKRSLADNYARRAYPGAPPTIPHALISEKGIGGKDCLQCHENGGYSAEFKAFTPIAPHPTYTNCKQCHVPQKVASEFRGSNWQKKSPPKLHNVAMEGAPPQIPHTLQLRGNCLSCHAGSAAPKEIRTPHPEWVNCRQCHVPMDADQVFERPKPKPKIVKDSSDEQASANAQAVARWIAQYESKNSQP